MNEGYFTGVLDVYYAKMTTEDTSNSAPVYGAPAVLGRSIEVTISPVYREGKLDASNNLMRKVKRVSGYDVKLGLDRIIHAVLKDVLGRAEDANGVQKVNKGGDPPLVAVGFSFTADDGTVENWWIYKGRFSESEKSGKTESLDGIEYATPSIEGSFVPLMNSGDVSAVADSDNASIPASVFQNWFTAVYLPGASATPNANSLPIGAVLAVAALPITGISDTTVYVLTAADGERDAGTMWRRVSGAWAQYGI